MFKTAAFALSAAYAGVAGALLAIHLGSVNALVFLPAVGALLVGTALGGFGHLFGTMFGALFIVAPLKAEDWGLDIELATPLPPLSYGVCCSCSF